MTEAKKEYILDAFSELEDAFVAEAAEYVKVKVKRNYWRELAAAAACIAALLVTAATFRYLPIGRNSESKDGATSQITAMQGMEKTEETREEIKPEGVQLESSVEITSSTKPELSGNTEESSTDAIQNESFSENGKGQSELEQAIGNSLGPNKELYSKGYEWELVADAAKGIFVEELSAEKNGGLHTNSVIIESTQAESSVMWKSAEEILAEGRDIFLGTVTNMQIYRAAGDVEKYFTIATVKIEESIRGNLVEEQNRRIFLPKAVVDGMIITTSINGDLDYLQMGSQAIFMPNMTNEDTGFGSLKENKWLCYADFADYYYSEGRRYIFLETKDGVSYAEEVYEIPSEEKVTLEDVAAYLRKMVQE